MSVGARMRSVRRRARCARRGHYWLQRMDAHANVELFCRRCGRVHADESRSRQARAAGA